MPIPTTERRAGAESTSAIVRRSLLMQRLTGTLSAIEYLKAQAVQPEVIQRVLSGQALREEDAKALGLVTDEAWAEVF